MIHLIIILKSSRTERQIEGGDEANSHTHADFAEEGLKVELPIDLTFRKHLKEILRVNRTCK